jgi:hypothetical protein
LIKLEKYQNNQQDFETEVYISREIELQEKLENLESKNRELKGANENLREKNSENE